jgi:hypothetical protein
MQSSHGGAYSTSTPKAAASSPSYETVAAALTAASNAPILSTLLAAVTVRCKTVVTELAFGPAAS